MDSGRNEKRYLVLMIFGMLAVLAAGVVFNVLYGSVPVVF